MYFVVFFFKQKTAYEMRISDWSSDVCSSDLPGAGGSRSSPRRVSQHGGARRSARLARTARGRTRRRPAEVRQKRRRLRVFLLEARECASAVKPRKTTPRK